MKFLGIDPANRCGYAHSSRVHGIWNLVDKFDKHPGRRLERFRRFLFECKRDLGIDAIGYEDASFGSPNPNVQAGHNELAGVIKLVAAEWEVPVFGYKPAHLKSWLTGNGRASKEQMINSVNTMFGLNVDSDDIADAITVMERLKTEDCFKGAFA